jgi:hypothetical protein
VEATTPVETAQAEDTGASETVAATAEKTAEGRSQDDLSKIPIMDAGIPEDEDFDVDEENEEDFDKEEDADEDWEETAQPEGSVLQWEE